MSSDDEDLFGEKSDAETETKDKESTQENSKSNDFDDIFGASDEDEDNNKDDKDDVDDKEEDSDREKNDDENKDDSVKSDDENNNNNATSSYNDDQQEIEYGPPETFEYVNLPKPKPGSKLYYLRVPNILGIEPKPFDPDTYEELRVDNDKSRNQNPETIARWRYATDDRGIVVRETNSKFVRWSDGSLSLFIGGEVYDATEQDMKQDNNYLFVRQKGFITGHGQLTSKLTFRPTSLTSKSHQKLTAGVLQRHKKERKIKIVSTDIDPEKDKESKEKMEEERIRASETLETARQNKRRSYGGGLNADALEADFVDDDGGYDDNGSIAAIKARYKKTPTKGGKKGENKPRRKSQSDFIDDDDEEDDDFVSQPRKRGKKYSDDEDEDY